MDERLRRAARDAIGFMPEDEGVALYEAALAAAGREGPLLEIGTFCGKSTIYLAAAARERGNVVFTIDHHRGSEEHQPGQEYHDPRLTDGDGRVDTFPVFRATIEAAGLEPWVAAIVAPSEVAATRWHTPLGLVFVDGGHSMAAARTDFLSWAPKVAEGGLLAIHDVFPDPAEGGRPPFVVYRAALSSGAFQEVGAEGSLRVLERVGDVDRLAESLAAEEP